MPIEPVRPRLYAPDVTQHAIEALADTLAMMAVEMPSRRGPDGFADRQRFAQRMDDAIATTLNLSQHRAAAATNLMQTLLEAPITDAQMVDSTQLQNEYPQWRFVIGKVSLYYLQADRSPANRSPADAPTYDGYEQAQAAAVLAVPTASLPRPSPVSFRSLGLPATTLATPPVRPSTTLWGTSESPLRAPLPRDVAPPFDPLKVASMTPRGHSPAWPVPAPLAATLAAFVNGDIAAETDVPFALHAPETQRLWQDPYIDVRDGQSYERATLPTDVNLTHLRPNDAARAFVRCWAAGQKDTGPVLAMRLQAIVPQTSLDEPATDPVVVATGETFGASELMLCFENGRMPEAPAQDWQHQHYPPNRLLVALMLQFNIGMPAEPAPSLPQALWADDFVGALLQHARDDETHAEVQVYREDLQALQRTYEAVMTGCNSAIYTEAFNAGLDVGGLIDEITALLEDVRAPALQTGLLLWRSDCFRLREQYDKANQDLLTVTRLASSARAIDVQMWGRAALVMALMGDMTTAPKLATIALERDPDSREGLAAKGRCMAEDGRLREASIYYTRAMMDTSFELTEVRQWALQLPPVRGS